MKRLLIAICLLVSINDVKAQTDAPVPGGVFGLRFMPVFTSFNFTTEDNGTVKGSATFGYGFGAVLGANLSNNVGLQGEVLYNSLSQKYMDMDQQRTVDLSYINVPLLLVLNTGVSQPVNFNVVFGPQLGLNVGSDIKTTGGSGVDTLSGVLAVKKEDFGVAYGAGFDFAISPAARISIGYRGVSGLVDISDRSTSITTNEYYILQRSHVNTNAAYIGLTFLF